MLSEIGHLRLRDLEVFVEVARAKSIRQVARRLRTTSGQISKIVQNLEKRLGSKLFRRSTSGVLLTSQGVEVLELAKELLESGEKIEGVLSHAGGKRSSKILAIAGTSFLNTHFCAPLTCLTAESFPHLRFRFLDLAPDQIDIVGLRNGFEIAVHYGAISWPKTWISKRLGKSKWLLCCGSHHSLIKRPTLKQILDYPFVIPTYWTNERLVQGNDQFPIPISKRKIGFETATADSAVAILIATEQIAFLPSLLVNPFIARGELREIRCAEIPLVENEVYLSVKSDVVPDAVFQALSVQMSRALKG